MSRAPIAIASRLVVVVAALAPLTARAGTPAGSALAHKALALCHSAAKLPADLRDATLRDGLAHAEAAVRADAADAVAHFAVFCNLGRRLETAGVSFGALRDVRHARRALDRSLELAPDFADAVAAKGTMLHRLPRVLGGDDAEAERLLRHAFALDPENVHTRVALAEVLRAHGASAEAERVETVGYSLPERPPTGDLLSRLH